MFSKHENPIFPPGPRDDNLVHSAVLRPQTGIGDTDKYRTVEAKAAALFHSLIMNHAFHNGNKRTALVSLVVFMDRNERRLEISDDEIFDFVVAVARKTSPFDGEPDEIVEQIRRHLRAHSVAGKHDPKEMRVSNFLQCCEAAGASVRRSANGQSWVIRGQNESSITIERETNKLAGMVVKRYLSMLDLLSTVRTNNFSL